MHRILALIVAMSGCAGSSWTKAGATPEELDRDRGICARYARAVAELRGSANVYSATLRRCMEDRGWAEAPESSGGDP